MPITMVMSVAALVALLPAALLALRGEGRRDGQFSLALAVALAGPLAWVAVAFAPGWQAGFSAALWLTVVMTLGIFLAVAAWVRPLWRLAPLLLPYLVLLGLLATIWHGQPQRIFLAEAPAGWVGLHVGVSVAAYALLTLGAVAGLAVFLQERALKAKRPTALTHALPAVAEGEMLQTRLLAASGAVLALGVASGLIVRWFESGAPFAATHKSLFSLATLAVLLALFAAQHLWGLRGRRTARIVLLAWLLLTLAYPGVKFVTDVLLA